jgi:hypothetical protein
MVVSSFIILQIKDPKVQGRGLSKHQTLGLMRYLEISEVFHQSTVPDTNHYTKFSPITKFIKVVFLISRPPLSMG